jgi:hypothetical protein
VVIVDNAVTVVIDTITGDLNLFVAFRIRTNPTGSPLASWDSAGADPLVKA